MKNRVLLPRIVEVEQHWEISRTYIHSTLTPGCTEHSICLVLLYIMSTLEFQPTGIQNKIGGTDLGHIAKHVMNITSVQHCLLKIFFISKSYKLLLMVEICHKCCLPYVSKIDRCCMGLLKSNLVNHTGLYKSMLAQVIGIHTSDSVSVQSRRRSRRSKGWCIVAIIS